MKSFSLDHVLSLPEDQIRIQFPHGLVMHGKRWIPADPKRRIFGF